MERGLARYAPLTGVAAALLGVLAFVLMMSAADEPETDAPPTELAAWMSDKSWEIICGAWIWWLGVAAFLWFLGSLRSVLGPAEGGTRRVTSIAFSAGAVFAVFAASLLGPVFAGATASEFDERPITPETAEALWVAGNAFFGLSEMAAGVLCLAVGLVVVRTGVLPKWYGWLSLVYGVWLLIIPIGWIAFMGFPIWILVTTVLVWLAESKRPTTHVA